MASSSGRARDGALQEQPSSFLPLLTMSCCSNVALDLKDRWSPSEARRPDIIKKIKVNYIIPSTFSTVKFQGIPESSHKMLLTVMGDGPLRQVQRCQEEKGPKMPKPGHDVCCSCG